MADESQSLNKCHGRYVDFIVTVLPDTMGNVVPLKPAIGQVMIFEASYHGDRDEHWVVIRTVAARQELARFNARHLHSIHWRDA